MTTPNTDTPRTVVGLKVENYKRVQAVDITPDPSNPLVAISGANAQGKSSVLDALWSALQSTAATRTTRTTRPVRDGADSATVRVDLGDIIVTRKWNKAGKSTLFVESADTGARFTSPQKLLDELVGKLSFDPLAFTRMGPKEQASTLIGLVDLEVDLEALAAERAETFEARTAIGREKKSFGEPPAFDPAMSTEETPAAELMAEIREAESFNASLKDAWNEVDRTGVEIYDIDAEIRRLQERREELVTSYGERKIAAEKMGEQKDVPELLSRLEDLDATNAAIRVNNVARDTLERVDALAEDYEAHTKKLAELDKVRADALAAAKFPLAGLSFDDDGVTYNGVPLGQASAAEQLRVSCALAAATNPNIRVMRITDGSLLDSASRELLSTLADERGFQVWVELVDESGEVGVVIEDGFVKDSSS